MLRRAGVLALVLGGGLLAAPRDAARAQDVVGKTDGGRLRGDRPADELEAAWTQYVLQLGG